MKVSKKKLNKEFLAAHSFEVLIREAKPQDVNNNK